MYRYWFVFFFAILLSACTAVTEEVRATVEYAFKSAEDAELPPEKMEDFPYTSLYARWQGKARALIILGYVDKPNDWHFITADKETLVLRNGRVIRTQGLEDNLRSISNLGKDPLQCIITSPENCNRVWQRYYDYEVNGKTFSRKVRSTFSKDKSVTVEMPFGAVKATVVTEEGRFSLTDESFINTYWIEDDGHVLKSEQKVLPQTPKLTLTQVTWIGRDYSAKASEKNVK
ncbi:YjbF family lipoprotein [Idiomarina sp. Sol25]|uniref:YjbF family lipoprotein n=1 Tax=Idiomarina sp. Sol25 TaxID=3064000 RepID=UPI00294B1F11|nr:YjbF family lipoprotein [Idiomarina sp. Sol25]MDV6328060.1 YjbF family lipoprotein [Idiomarina sp. Sol25]